MKLRIFGISTLFAFALIGLACDPPATDDEADEADEAAAEVDEDGPAGIDDGGIDSFSDDPELAERGEELFASKGCVACHQMDRQTPTGPALGDVTERRSPAWLARQIMHPDEMQQQDPTTQALMEDYPAPMTPMAITPEEAEAIIAHLYAQTQ